MKQRNLVSTLTLGFIALIIGSMQISAQEDDQMREASELTISELKDRILQLETKQNMLTWFIAVIGVFAGGLVAIQGAVSITQLRREGERESRQAQHEKKRDAAERMGVVEVSKIMGVVRETLESRLIAEKEARKEKEDLQSKVEFLDDFLKKFQKNIEKKRRTIEDTVSQLAKTPRQGFRSKINELNNCAQQVDEFVRDSAPLEAEKRQFSQRVPYICGIAAHYSNQPEHADKYLSKVIAYPSREADEDEVEFNRRVANAYYYLGLIKSNFDIYRDAIDFFNNAKRLDPQSQDLLTKVAESEAWIMTNDFKTAEKIIAEVEEELEATEKRDGRLRNSYLRLRSRAALNRVSIVMMEHEANWHEVATKLLDKVCEADPLYYYATATLAQVYADRGDLSRAKELFQNAYQTIERSGDLITVTEVRIKILLLMVAGMCCKHGLEDEKRSEEHLSKADALLDSLPKIDSQPCTVFSTLSKRNKTSGIIRHHIESIRKGKVLLKPGE